MESWAWHSLGQGIIACKPHKATQIYTRLRVLQQMCQFKKKISLKSCLALARLALYMFQKITGNKILFVFWQEEANNL